MQKCRLDGKAVYAFKVLNENEVMDVEYEKRLRRASEQGNLKCEDCGADIIFKFGKVKIPHFAHKNDLLGGGCSYSKESEEHINAKKLILDLMIKNYPDAYAEMRYRFSNGKWADLYFEFNDGSKLVIEFQRELSSLVKWEDKRKFYRSINVKDLWLAKGKKEDFEDIIREHDFIFQHRLFLNDNSNKLLALDVEKERLVVASKMLVKDTENNEVIMDKIYYNDYDLNNIRILRDGTVECNFDNEFNDLKDRFVQSYLKQKQIENEKKEQLIKALIEQRKREVEEKEKLRKILEQQELLKKTTEEQDRKRKEDEEWRKKNIESFQQITMPLITNENKPIKRDINGFSSYD